MNNKNSNKTPVASTKKKSGISKFLSSKKASRSMTAIVMTIVFIAVVIGLNVLTNIISNKYSAMTFDFTENDVYKLTDTTVDQLKNLNKDVNLYVLTTEANLEESGDYYVQINKLIKEMDKTSDHITLKYIDLAKDPNFTSKYTNINWYSSTYLMLVEHGDNYIAVAPDDVFLYEQDTTTGEYMITGQKIEQATLSAILNVITEEKVGVAFLSVNSQIDSSAFKTLLSNNAYKVSEISLLSDEIPEDCKFVVIFAPSNDIDKNAYDTLTKWLNNDGKYGHTLIYIPNSTIKLETPNLDTLLEEWNMAITDGWIWETDEQSMYMYSDTPPFTSLFGYESSEFTDTLMSTEIPVIMDHCMPIEIINSGATSLLASSESAVIYPFDASDDWTPDIEDPQKLYGAAISSQGNADNTKSSNVIIIGSFTSLSDYFLSLTSANNSAYYINLFNTIADRDNITITVEGKVLDSQDLGNSDVATAEFLIVLVRYIIPAIVVVVGIVFFIRRRHK